MKLLLLLAATLAAAAMLLWLCARRAAPAPATPAPEVAAAEADPGAQASLSTPETSPAPRVAASGTAKVRGQVVLARTKKPVDRGEASLEYTLAGSEHKRGERKRDAEIMLSASAPIDADGRFAFELPLGAQLNSIVVSPLSSIQDGGDRHHPPPPSLGFEPHSQHLHETVVAEGVELSIEVEPPVELRGLVRDAATLAPLEGARIRIPEAAGMVAEVHSGADGRFVLSGIPPRYGAGHWSLRVDRLDHLASLSHLTDEQLAPGAPELLVELARGLAVAGCVVDARNAPVPGLALRLRAVGFDRGLDLGASVVSTTTDANGEFRYAPVPPCNSLQVEIDAQRRNGLDFLAQRRDLGPLHADRTDLQVAVQGCGILEVQARLSDGTLLGPRDFQMICANGPALATAGSSAEGLLLRVPLGVELELEAYASAKDAQEAGTYLRGRGRAFLDPSGAAPAPLRIVLGERGSFVAPPPQGEPRELVLPDEPFLHATVDVQLFDAGSGLPIGSGRCVSISGSGASLMSNKIEDGWVRVRGRPGRHAFEVEVDGGTPESLEVVIPASGYGTAEWRVRVGP
jgi:hypothetical protein